MCRRILCRTILYFLPVLFSMAARQVRAAQSFQIARVAYFSHSSSSPFSQGEIFSKTMA